MKITKAEFIISAVGPSQYPVDGLPEMALAGRSNVGKSSLINRIIDRRKLARTSSQPGKTQQLNYYMLNDKLYFVDLPGYGFAKVSKTEREKWGKFIEEYLTKREELKLLLLLVDVRHEPSANDKTMYEWVIYHEIPTVVVATKADKVPRSRWPQHTKIVRQSLGMTKDAPLVLFSSETGMGKEELWAIIEDRLGLAVSPDAAEDTSEA